MTKYTLMNKNKKIFDFVYSEEDHFIVSFERNYPENEKYAPLCLIKNGSIDKIEFYVWWKNRQIPASRSGLKEMLSKTNIYDEDNFDLLDAKVYCLSLSDQYWVKEVNEDVSWESINFFDNEFSEDIGKNLFENKKLMTHISLNSPDMTSNGNYEKRWKIIDGDRYLLKSGSKIYNQEPFNELIATKLYERILNKGEYVEYSIIFGNGRAISKCKNFITKDTEIVPAVRINEFVSDNENKYNHYIKCLKELGIKDAEESLDKMIVCDYLIANKDRHFNNFGAIRDVNTLEFTGVCPIFDNGSSLWYDENDMYVGEFFLTKPFKEYENEQLDLVKNLDWLDVSKLDDFPDEVRRILSLNKLLSKERIDKIVREVELRIKTVKDLKKFLSE